MHLTIGCAIFANSSKMTLYKRQFNYISIVLTGLYDMLFFIVKYTNIISDTHGNIVFLVHHTPTPTDFIMKVFSPLLLLSSRECEGLGKTIRDGSDNGGK